MATRLSKIIKELNIGIETACESLAAKGEVIEKNPNTKLTDEQEAILRKEFSKDGNIKAEVDRINQQRQEEKKASSVAIEGFEAKVIKEKKQEEEFIETTVHESLRPKFKVVEKIDLNATKRKKKKDEKAEKPVETEVKVEEKPVEKVQEKQEEKVQPKVEEKTEVAEIQQVPEIKAEEKVEVKQEENSEEKQENSNEVFRLNQTKIKGTKVVGTIDLSNFSNDRSRPSKDHKKHKDDKKHSSKEKNEKGENTNSQNKNQNEKGDKKRRERITRPHSERVTNWNAVGGNDDKNKQNGGGNNNQNSHNKKNNKQKNHVKRQEVDEKDVQENIKKTLERLTNRGKKNKGPKISREEKIKRQQELDTLQEIESKTLKLTEFVTANELATMMGLQVTQIISTCMSLGLFVSINQRLDAETINIVAEEFGFQTEFVSAEVVSAITEEEDEEADLVSRPPIVTVMGHVDHGKTSLLDYIRKTNVIAGEAGGITQHIGAYNVKLEDGRHITFLDTPGHEAFTAMRARGAKVTDLAIIIVAADDDVMPQTKEAINHASAAGVPIVFAINKIDKPGANPDKVKESLAAMNYLVEEWGGKYQSQDISAKKGLNIKELLEKVLLEADILELKANPNRKASGSIIESSLDKGRGYVATVLVSNGTLRIGDVILAGTAFGKVRAMFNERGQKIKEAGPAEPAIILGLNGAPQAGDNFNVFDAEHEAREIANKREQLQREQGLRTSKHLTLDEIGRRIALGNFQELNVIVKGDVDGSIEALADSLIKLSTEEIQVNVIHKAVGQISESDVMLAAASNAIIVGFQVRPSTDARRIAEREQVDIRIYSIIYDAIEEIKSAMEGMLSPDIKEEVTALLEVRATFKITKVGTIAGCMVKEGKVKRSNKLRLIRDGIVIYNGELASLKREKDDVKEVASGYECGLNIAGYNDIKEGDLIETYEEIEVKRSL